ncbi:MAG: tyrosine-protein phosphatase [Acidobacteriota bacterium]
MLRTKRRGWLAVLAAALLLGGAAAAWLLTRPHEGEYHVRPVIPGKIYAGGQPGAADLRALVARFSLRSVVNLRGPRQDETWYQNELAACRELSLAHADVRVKLDDWPPQHEVWRFVDLLNQFRGPVLLHCKNGVDRSGWGAAVARALAGEPLEAALAELSATSGHLCVERSCPLHRFFALYSGWLGGTGETHSGAAFRRWAREHYCPPPYDALLELLDGAPVQPAAAGQELRFTVRARNRSSLPWTLSSRPDRGIRLGARLIGPLAAHHADPVALFREHNELTHDLGRAGLEEGLVPPGDSRIFSLAFPAPPEPGHYLLQIDMVDELVHWFSDLGGAGIIIQIEVTAGG